MIAYDYGEVHLQAKVKVRKNGELVDTTMGRILLGELLPESVKFAEVNKVMTKKALAKLIDHTYRNAGTKETVILADRLKDIGYEYATRAGISICINDMKIPLSKEEFVEKAETDVLDVEQQYTDGLITSGEKYNKVVDIWSKVTEDVANAMMDEIKVDYFRDKDSKRVEAPKFQLDFYHGRFRCQRIEGSDSPAWPACAV